MKILIGSAFIVLPITSAFSADISDSNLSLTATNPLIIAAVETTPDPTAIEALEVADHPEQNIDQPEHVDMPEHIDMPEHDGNN